MSTGRLRDSVRGKIRDRESGKYGCFVRGCFEKGGFSRDGGLLLKVVYGSANFTVYGLKKNNFPTIAVLLTVRTELQISGSRNLG